ncbi:WxcM-like domain-containing protein [Mucilaginibacter terrenus]|uniref:WxcM-like domain-containing protein n=1 Tax=Mucilaginibacter terrenus TaxID=2482727 RepID=A0A3E2NV69_9SPHI|nr:FdtA/QdtA family cupin domain-containing protein [Mucilaginibacter terrenus]RFZ84811.1 WxcM-like domain-containing protein [Mucilaginibacter terrenus]
MNLTEVKLINLPKVLDERGNLSFMEEGEHVPFDIRRTYWIYDVPGGEQRGGHSYKTNQELIVALSGSFDVIVQDGAETKVFTLNRSYYGLYIPAGIWRHMENFSTNSLAFVVASTDFDEDDYECEFDDYVTFKAAAR